MWIQESQGERCVLERSMTDWSHGAMKSGPQDKCLLLSQSLTQQGQNHSKNEVKQNRSTQVTEAESHPPFRVCSFTKLITTMEVTNDWKCAGNKKLIDIYRSLITKWNIKQKNSTDLTGVPRVRPMPPSQWGKLSSQIMWTKCSELRIHNWHSIPAKALLVFTRLFVHSCLYVWIYTRAIALVHSRSESNL